MTGALMLDDFSEWRSLWMIGLERCL